VVTVLEDLEPLLARRLFVAQAARVERRGLRADRDPLRSIRDPIAALREEGDELVPLLTRRVLVGERACVVVVDRIEIRRLLETGERSVVITRSLQEIGGTRVVLGGGLRISGELSALPGGVRRAVPLLAPHEAALRRLPELLALERVRRVRVRLSG